MVTHGPFSFATNCGNGSERFFWTDPLGSCACLPQSSSTNRRWSWDNNCSPSSNVGPTGGQGGGTEGYVYNEMTSPGAFCDTFDMRFDTTLDAAACTFSFTFYTNQRGNCNNATANVQISECCGGWTNVGATFGGPCDACKVCTSGTQIWTLRTVDLSACGANNSANTRVRILITAPSSGTSWHNDYGIDTITITGTPNTTYEVTGDVRDIALCTVATVRVVLLKHDGAAEASRVYEIIAHTNANGSGLYTFGGLSDNDSRYMVIAYNDETNDRRGATNDNLTPTEE